MRNGTLIVACSILVGVLSLGAVGLFVVDVGSTAPEPVPFDETVQMGTEFDDDLETEQQVDFPNAQVFYSQYRNVVGYPGVERFVHEHHQDGHEQRFGYPLAVYVSDFSGTDLELTEAGYPRATGDVGWTDAESALFVVGSDARTPAGETVVPFSNRDDAESYAAAYGGTVLTWTELLEQEFAIEDAATVRERVDEQLAAADELVATVQADSDRPVASVVGEDADTIQGAIDAAPPETTVVVPEGTYEELLEIDRPITLAGDGNVTIRGDGEHTVIDVRADGVAVRNLRITDVGETTRPEEQDTVSDSGTDGDTVLELAYAAGDAGVSVDGATRVLVEDVTIETPANGVLLRDSPETVVRNVSVYGGDDWSEAYMGVMTMRSADGVIENSTFRDGRDGIYTHRSHGLVFRNNSLERNRIGVHLMYTSETVIADNDVRNAVVTGIHVMTNPHRNAVVGNEVRNSPTGLRTEGWNSYVAGNVVVDNELGMTTEAGNSIYEGNVVAENDEGIRATHLLPTNRVVGNDFLDNHVHATARDGTLRIWTENGVGNYWDGAVGRTDGVVIDRSYSATDLIDSRLHRTGGTPALGQSPQFDELSTLDGTVAGMREASVVDTAPRCAPANPELLESAGLDVVHNCDDVTP